MHNWQDALEWHESLEGATQDEIAWKSRQLVFDDIPVMKEVASYFLIKLGIQYDEVSKRGGPVEKTMNLAKRMLQKQIQDNRKNVHGKTINSTSKNNS